MAEAANALRCAERMIAALEEWNAERALRDEPPLAMGIGVNYGPAVIGDVGGGQSLSFTVIGDTVNTASRLQRMTRSLVTPLIVSDAAVTAAKSAPCDVTAALAILTDRGEHPLRGRTDPVRIWTSRQPG